MKFVFENPVQLRGIIDELKKGEIDKFAIYNSVGRRLIYDFQHNLVRVIKDDTGIEQDNEWYVPQENCSEVEVIDETVFDAIENDDTSSFSDPDLLPPSVSDDASGQVELTEENQDSSDPSDESDEVGGEVLNDEVPEVADEKDDTDEILDDEDIPYDEDSKLADDKYATYEEQLQVYKNTIGDMQLQLDAKDEELKKCHTIIDNLKNSTDSTDGLIQLLVNKGYDVTVTKKF